MSTTMEPVSTESAVQGAAPVVSPIKLAHVVFRTSQYKELVGCAVKDGFITGPTRPLAGAGPHGSRGMRDPMAPRRLSSVRFRATPASSVQLKGCRR